MHDHQAAWSLLKLSGSPGVLWGDWAPGKGSFLGQACFGEFALLLPLTRLLVYPMAVVGDWATRYPVDKCCMGSVAGVVPGLLLPSAFREHHPHQCLPPAAGGAVQWKSCSSPCFSHLPVTEPGCPAARATPVACKQSA